MRAEPLEPRHRQPRHGHAMRENSANGVRMQGGIANAVAGADFSKQRPGLAFGHRLPGFQRPHRAGLDIVPPRQADLSPLPCLVGLAARQSQPQPTRQQPEEASGEAADRDYEDAESFEREAPGAPRAAPAPAGLPREDVQKLQTALRDLAECRRLLDVVLNERS